MYTQGATQEASSVNGTLWRMSEHGFDQTQAFRNVLIGKNCGGKKARPFKEEGASRRTLNLMLQSHVCQDVPRTSLVGDSVMIRMYVGVTQNDLCTYHTVSFPTLFTTLLTSEVQWLGLGYPGFSADPLQVAKALLFLRIKIASSLPPDGKKINRQN